MLTWAEDLKLAGNNLYMDSRVPRGRCFVSHAHSDHLGVHEETICTPATAAFAEHRVGPAARVVPLSYGTSFDFDPDISLRLLPAPCCARRSVRRVSTASDPRPCKAADGIRGRRARSAAHVSSSTGAASADAIGGFPPSCGACWAVHAGAPGCAGVHAVGSFCTIAVRPTTHIA